MTTRTNLRLRTGTRRPSAAPPTLGERNHFCATLVGFAVRWTVMMALTFALWVTFQWLLVHLPSPRAGMDVEDLRLGFLIVSSLVIALLKCLTGNGAVRVYSDHDAKKMFRKVDGSADEYPAALRAEAQQKGGRR